MPVDPKQIRDVFLDAAELPMADRATFLTDRCGDDVELRAAVDRLLAAHAEPFSLLNRSAPGIPTGVHVQISEPPGTMVGPYKLLEQIGEGGMGTVWMAQQQEPVKRVVALKLIKAGLDSKQVIARFEAERQALAMMDHANIARVLDGGATDGGRPYFVMDLIKGVPITRYCDQHHLTPRQRLELFIPVCEAVQHAHQKGIIHRDLKPSNVLVALYDGKPVPKVIDFGVAKAAGQPLTEQTLVTGFGNIVGTLEYMSPEQAEVNQLDIDTRSDIYSLGVLLYELLTGCLPFTRKELEKAGMLEMLRVIREQEPTKPSTKLSTAEGLPSLAANRGTDPAKLTKLVRGELDWIVMKALEKDRNRRYETASGFALDVQRYLADEPVQAGPPSAAYRLRKFVKKNRAALTTAAAIACLLVGGTLVSTWQALRATRAEWKSEQQTTRATMEAEQSRRLLYVSDIKVAHQLWEAGNMPGARELLDRHRPQPGQEDLRGFEWHYLDRLSRSSARQLAEPQFTLRGHTDRVHRLAYSADGRRIVAGGHDHTVRIWDVPTGREVLAFGGHAGPVFSVAFSPDGHRIASGGEGGALKVWDAETGQEHFAIERDAVNDAPHAGLGMVAYSPDGRWLAAGVDRVVKVWSAETGRERFILRGHTSWVSSVAFRGDGRRLVTSGDDGTIRVWELETGKPIAELKGHFGQVWSAVYSPDGRRIASGGIDMTVRIWDAELGRELLVIEGHTNEVTCVAFHPGGRQLASTGYDRTVRLWDVERGQELATHRGHTEVIGGLAFSPDGRQLASSSWDKTVRVWDAADGQRASRLEGHTDEVIFAAYSPAGPFLATAGKDRVVKVWDTNTGRELRTLRGHKDEVVAVAFGPDGRRLASASFDGTVKVWEAATGRELLTFRGHQDRVRGVAFSPDGRFVVSAGGAARSGDRSVRVWDMETGQERLRLDGHATEVRCAAFSPDGRRIVSTGHNDGTVRLWDAATGRELLTLNTGTSGAGVAVFSPDGRSLAVTTQGGGTVQVWDAASGDERQTLRGHTGNVWAVAYSPDGRRIASGGTDKTIRIWDAATGQELLTLKGHAGAVTALVFRPDGRQLVSTSLDRTARLWDAAPRP